MADADAGIRDRKPAKRFLRTRSGKVQVSRSPLHEQVAERLRDMIVTGKMKAGEKVPVSTMAAQLDVSLTPLREALKVLAEERLVELTPNRGARVVPVTIADTQALFEVMAGIEALAAELTATRITAERLTLLEERHARMRRHHEAGERDAYFSLNREIHDLIVEFAENPILADMRAKLALRAERVRFIALHEGKRREQAMREHEDIMIAFRNRDPDGARKVWRTHLKHSGEETCRVLMKQDTADASCPQDQQEG